MPLQGVLPLRLVGGVVVVVEGCERHLRVDDHVAVVGEVEYHVGNLLAPRLIVAHRLAVFLQHRLLLILQSLLQAHVLQERVQPQLAEVALRLGLSREGLGELVGPLAQGLRLFLVGLDGGPQVLQRRQPVLVALLHTLPHLPQTVVQGIEQQVELLLVGCGEFLGALLQDVFRGRVDLLANQLRLFLQLFLLLAAQLLQLRAVLAAQVLQLCGILAAQLLQLGGVRTVHIRLLRLEVLAGRSQLFLGGLAGRGSRSEVRREPLHLSARVSELGR